MFFSRVDKIKKYIEKLNTKEIKHVKGKSLYDHLVRVSELLSSWKCEEDFIIAGLCHSLYTTEYFKQEIVSLSKRGEVKNILGDFAEDIIYHFAIIKRDTFKYSEEEEVYSFTNYVTNQEIEIRGSVGDALAHILLANDLDHLDSFTIGYKISWFYKYKNVYSRLSHKAKESLDLIINVENKEDEYSKDDKPFIRFLGHAGVQIANNKVSIVVDPWLYASSRENPIIEGFDPTQKTIDYLIPEPKNNPQELAPDIICLSHFHTHHAPLKEILEFAKIKPITIFCPLLNEGKLLLLKNKIGDYMYGRLTFIFLENDAEFKYKNYSIKCFLHKSEEGMTHVMYYVNLLDTSIFHVVDAKSNKENDNLSFDASWERVYGLKPDYFFVGSAGHNIKIISNSARSILEAASLTPVQAAKLSVLVKAKNAGIVGIYNHSVWDDRVEMGVSVSDAESQFYWALSFLAPAVKIHHLRPGDIFKNF